MSTNPVAYQEMMKGHDRALSNLENIPQGFQHLVRMQHTMNSVNGVQEPKVRTQITESKSSNSEIKLTSEPFPNPWITRSTASRQSRSREMQKKAHPNVSKLFTFTDEELQEVEKAFAASSIGSGKYSRLMQPSASADPILPTDLGHYEARYHQQLKDMEEMGFHDKTENIRALLSTGGNVQSAIEWLMNRKDITRL